MRVETSIILATYNRKYLLERSLYCYESQCYNNQNIEFIIIDDHSTDGTREFVLDWSKTTGIRTVVLTPSPKNRVWRDCGAILNYGIRASCGDYLILTHPEVMPGRKSVSGIVEKLKVIPWTYVCCRVYYLRQSDQDILDQVDWKKEGNLAIRSLPGFYDIQPQEHPHYTHQMTDQIGHGGELNHWESWVFGGVSRKTMKKLGGMLETQEWGSVDVAFLHRRRVLEILNVTLPEDETIVIHQNHDLPNDKENHRIEKNWRDELDLLKLSGNPSDLCYPKINFLGWD